jgi:hypothetical protein
MSQNLKDIYDFNMICTYCKIKDFYESDILYKIQFLQLFFLKNYDDKVINNTSYLLFKHFYHNNKIKELLEETSLKDDLLTAFRMFFAFPTLHMFHKLLCDFYHEKDFDEENYKQLINFTKTNY